MRHWTEDAGLIREELARMTAGKSRLSYAASQKMNRLAKRVHRLTGIPAATVISQAWEDGKVIEC